MKNIAMFLIVAVVAAGVATADVVTLNPVEPQAGQPLTITYDATGRPLAGELKVHLRAGYNDWKPQIVPDPVMNSNGEIHVVTIAVPTQATEIAMVFRNGDQSIWDNNDDANWVFAVTNGLPNAGVAVAPDPIEAGQQVTVTYDSTGGPLAGASTMFLHYGFNDWNPLEADVAMTSNGAGIFEATVAVKSYAFEFDATFDDGVARASDNNDGFDWRFAVTGTVPRVTVVPDPPVAGQPVTVTYNSQDTPLDGEPDVYLHWGINDFSDPYEAPAPMMTSNGGGMFSHTIPELPIRACNFAFVFNNTGDMATATIWDSNDGNDWNYPTVGCKEIVSELDGLYLAKYRDQWDPTFDKLYVGVTGNLAANGSAMVIFIDTIGHAGQQELRAFGAEEPPSLLPLASRRVDLNSCSEIGSGTTLAQEADFALYVNHSGGQVFFNEYSLYDTLAQGSLTCCGGGAIDILAFQSYVGATDVNDGNSLFEDPADLMYDGGFDDTNTSGVPSEVTTGLEVGIPRDHIGDLGRNETFDIFVAIMPNDGGVGGQFSNQTLPATSGGSIYCDSPEMFPLRADMSGVTTFRTTISWNSLPDFGGGDDLANGLIDPADYSGSADETQSCSPADPVVDGTVSLVPDPIQGEDVTVWYISTNGALDGADQVNMTYGYDGWTVAGGNVAMVATNGFTGSEFIATITLPVDSLQLDVNFDSNGVKFDDNNGQDWHFEIGRPASPTEPVIIVPDPADAGQPVLITYDAQGRVLEGEQNVCIHYGFNGWNPTLPDEPMLWNTTDCIWEITVDVASFAVGTNGLNMVFNNCGGTWDNNDGNDWHFEVNNAAGPPPWTMDGYLDGCATLIDTSSNGATELWAGMKDGWLYVATQRSQNDNDHFIFIAETPGVLAGQPWAKAGVVAQWDAYLAQEETNGWTGWFDLDGLTGRSNNPQNTDLPYLEGQFDLAAELGAIPTTINLVMGAWVNPNGGALVTDLLVPDGNGDGNITADEYAAVAMLDIQAATAFHVLDFNEDCLVDGVDLTFFEGCLEASGPAGGVGAGCDVTDFDVDGDIDLRDFAEYQKLFTN